MKAKLILVAGKADKSVIRLKLPTVVGRARDAGLMIRHPTVSRRHCEIFEVDGALYVRDTGSLNGTLIDDAPVKEAALKPGHTLTVGPLTFRAVYEYAGSPTMVSPLSPVNHQPDSPTVPSNADATALADESIDAMLVAPSAPPAVTPAGDSPPVTAVAAAGPALDREPEQDLEFEELVQADLNAPAGEHQSPGETADVGMAGGTAATNDAEIDLAPLMSDDELAMDFDLQGEASTPATTPPPSQPPEEELLFSEAGPASPGDEADSGLDLQLADESPAPIEPTAAPQSSAEEAEELTFDLDAPLSLPETAVSAEAGSPVASPLEEAPTDASAEVALQMDDDLELDFELTESAPSSSAAEQPGESVAAAVNPAVDELTFDLAEPEAPPIASEAEPELILGGDEPEFSLDAAPPAAAAPKAPKDGADLHLEFDLEPDRAPRRLPPTRRRPRCPKRTTAPKSCPSTSRSPMRSIRRPTVRPKRRPRWGRKTRTWIRSSRNWDCSTRGTIAQRRQRGGAAVRKESAFMLSTLRRAGAYSCLVIIASAVGLLDGSGSAAVNPPPAPAKQASSEPAAAEKPSPADQRAPANPRPTNRLAHQTSPYLLLHAHNPVDWYPWGEEALAKAKAEKKLVFLSIGYSSCYWCHVMERESFMDEEVAAYLNKHFVAIKIDREERPDIDEIYMTALQLLGRSGGWPLTMFLTPDGKPIVGGTYFPPRDKDVEIPAGRDVPAGAKQRVTGLLTLLQQVQRAGPTNQSNSSSTPTR